MLSDPCPLIKRTFSFALNKSPGIESYWLLTWRNQTTCDPLVLGMKPQPDELGCPEWWDRCWYVLKSALYLVIAQTLLSNYLMMQCIFYVTWEVFLSFSFSAPFWYAKSVISKCVWNHANFLNQVKSFPSSLCPPRVFKWHI